METLVHVNDRRVRTSAPPGSTLLDLLRDSQGLTATKPGCRAGDCGACMVLVGSRTDPGVEPTYEVHNSCLTTVASVAGCHVITAEGLSAGGLTGEGLSGDGLGPVQRALVDAGAVQCGFCTPGIVVALTWSLLSGTSPRRAVSGNLCRCTGYGGIRRACDMLAGAGAGADADALTGNGAGAAARLPISEVLPEPVLRVALALPPLAPEALDHDHPRWAAGATDEIPEHRHAAPGHRRPTLLRRVPELCTVEARDGGLLLGSAVTMAELQASALLAARWPGLVAHLEHFGSPAVRSSATVGGNLVHASPTADLAVPLLAMGATVVVTGPQGPRAVPIERFFLSYRHVDLRRREVVTSVSVPDPAPGSTLHVEKVAKREHDDIASASLAARIGADASGRLTDVHLAAGGVAPIPLLLVRTAEVLRGSRPEPSTVRHALAVLADEIAPIDDVRGSAAYKRALLGHLLVAALSARASEESA